MYPVLYHRNTSFLRLIITDFYNSSAFRGPPCIRQKSLYNFKHYFNLKHLRESNYLILKSKWST